MIAALLLAATPSPTSTEVTAVDADLVTPGLWGAVTLIVLAIGVYFLGRSMARRVRRVNQRARLQEQEEAELAAQEAGPAAAQRPSDRGTTPPADED